MIQSIRDFWQKSEGYRGIGAFAFAILALLLLYPSRQLDQSAKPENLVELV